MSCTRTQKHSGIYIIMALLQVICKMLGMAYHYWEMCRGMTQPVNYINDIIYFYTQLEFLKRQQQSKLLFKLHLVDVSIHLLLLKHNPNWPKRQRNMSSGQTLKKQISSSGHITIKSRHKVSQSLFTYSFSSCFLNKIDISMNINPMKYNFYRYMSK